MARLYYDPKVHDWAGPAAQSALSTFLSVRGMKQKQELIDQRKGELEAEQLQKKQTQDLKLADQNIKIFSNKDLPDGMRTKAYNSFGNLGKENKFFSDFEPLPEDHKWTPDISKFSTRAGKIWRDNDLSLKQKASGLIGLHTEATTPAQAKYLKGMVGQAIDLLKAGKEKTPTLQRKSRDTLVDGVTMRQDYDYNPQTGEEKRVGDSYPTKKAEGTTQSNLKQRIQQDWIKNYGTTRDKFDRIIEISPKQRIPRLLGWLRSRGIEEKKQRFTADELNQTEQAIMTDLRIDPKIQSNLTLLRNRGATEQEIRTLLKEYGKTQGW